MPITAAQKANRRRYIGASDISAIAGLNPWRGPWSVWCDKKLPQEEESGAARAGNYHEDGILAWAADELNVKLRRNQFRVAANGIQACHVDAMVVLEQDSSNYRLDHDRPWIVEAKLTGRRDDYGDPWTDQVPDWVFCQVQQQMDCVGKGYDPEVLERMRAFVPVFTFELNYPTHLMFEVPRCEESIAQLRWEAEEFHRNHLVPEDSPPERMEEEDIVPYLKRLIRPAGKVMPPSPGLQEAWELYLAAESAHKQSEILKEDVRATLLMELGDCEIGDLGEEIGKEIRFRKQSRRSLARHAGEDQCPECGVGTKVSESRVLRPSCKRTIR